MKTLLLASLAAVTITLFAGCTTAPVLRPPSTKLRDNLGHVAIVASSNSSRFHYQVPDSKADVAAERHSFEAVTPRMLASSGHRVTSAPEAFIIGAVALSTPVMVMSTAPIAHEIRRAYGLVVADTATAVDAARTTMDAAVRPIRFEQLLRDRVTVELRHQTPQQTVVGSPREADTLIELMVYEPNVSGREGINPAMNLSLGLRVRIVDARSGRELYYDYLDYRSSKHTLVTWAADDARLLHDEIDRCLANLSREIVAQLLTRPSHEIIDSSALAAHGIERRPPGLGMPGWSMPRSNRALASR
jgi:hypothetical protein